MSILNPLLHFLLWSVVTMVRDGSVFTKMSKHSLDSMNGNTEICTNYCTYSSWSRYFESQTMAHWISGIVCWPCGMAMMLFWVLNESAGGSTHHCAKSWYPENQIFWKLILSSSVRLEWTLLDHPCQMVSILLNFGWALKRYEGPK